MVSAFRRATRGQAKLRAALIGPAGSGKTYSSLAMATEIARLIKESGRGKGRIAVIDTECGSAELYAKKFEFDTMNLDRHSPLDYVDAICAAETEGYDVVVVDSLSHAWMGKDGALAQVDQAVERGAGNSFSAWRTVTPKHNQLVDKILSCKLHLIATIRAKTEYVQEKNDKGKTEIKKLGMAAVQREGLEYEFTLVGDIDLSNTLKISKTRLDEVMRPGDIYERPGAALAAKIYGWLIDGAPSPAREPEPARESTREPASTPDPQPAVPSNAVSASIDSVFADYLAGLDAAQTLADLDKAATGAAKPKAGTEQHKIATDRYRALRAKLQPAKVGAA